MKAVAKIRSGYTAVGTMARVISDPAIITMADTAGLDFIIFDMEHGAYSAERFLDVFAVSRPRRFSAFVRVPELSKGTISRLLDLGADGIMVPMVESAEQAEAFVGWAKYDPVGRRGFALAIGANDYAPPVDAIGAMARANEETITIAQIETVSGVEAAAAIAAVPGIDVLLIGPGDLSVSLGRPLDMENPELEKAIIAVAEAVANCDKILGLHAGLPLIKKLLPRGLRMISHSSDSQLMSAGLAAIDQRCRGLLEKDG